jgi:DNA-binding IscR family transcriptional regulator
MEGRMAIVPCLTGEACERSGSCSTRSLWGRADAALKKVLTETSIGDLADQSGSHSDFNI